MLLSLFWSKARGQSTGLRSLGGPCVLPVPRVSAQSNQVAVEGSEEMKEGWSGKQPLGKCTVLMRLLCVGDQAQLQLYSTPEQVQNGVSAVPRSSFQVLLTVPLSVSSEKTLSACPCLLANARGLEKAVLLAQRAFSCSLFYHSHFSAGQSHRSNAAALCTS